MKRIANIIMVFILVIAILCGCANPINSKHDSIESAVTTDETPGAISDNINIEYGHYYNCWDKDYLQIREKFDEYLTQTLRERNLNFKEDVEKRVVPDVFELEYYGTVFELQLSKERYENWSSFFCPEVSYCDSTSGIMIDIDVDTLGDRYMHLQAYSQANRMRKENTPNKTVDELLAIAKDYMEPRLAKLNLEDSDYRIVFREPYEGYHFYVFRFVSNDRLLGNTEIAQIKIDMWGFILAVTISGNILLDDDFVARLPTIDEKALLDEANNRFRESECDCNLSVSYRVFQREYDGKMYAELQCAIIPDNKNPETHHHDYINNQFCVFLELRD